MNSFEKLYGFFFLGIILLFIFTFLPVSKKTQAEQSREVLEIAFLDIGQGDATFITFPTGQQMLIDCSKNSGVLEKLGDEMDFFDKTIDYLVITHPDYDHYGGCIDVLKNYEVKEIIYTGKQKEGSFFEEFLLTIEEEKLEKEGKLELGLYTEIYSPEQWNIGDVQVKYLNDFDKNSLEKVKSNDSSIVIMISYGDQDVLLTGDAEKEAEQKLVDKYGYNLDVEILKIGHHGSNTSSIEPFLEVTSPEVGIISAGLDNSYHHPTQKILDRLSSFYIDIFRTDLQGTIYADINKSEYFIRTEH